MHRRVTETPVTEQVTGTTLTENAAELQGQLLQLLRGLLVGVRLQVGVGGARLVTAVGGTALMAGVGAAEVVEPDLQVAGGLAGVVRRARCSLRVR